LRADTDRLDPGALTAVIDDHADAGIDGVLIGGSMGVMQMLPDDVWNPMVHTAIEANRGRMELLVGVTDQSLARVLERVEALRGVEGIDGLVALTPSAFKLAEEELVDFYRAVADRAAQPVMLYELAPATGVALSVAAVARLAEHPNLAGIKLSVNLPKARQLRRVLPADFRVIPAEPQLLDLCAASGLWTEYLDGCFAVAPRWARAIADQAAAGHAAEAAATQARLNDLLGAWLATGQVVAAFTALLNARGLPGRYHPRPMRDLDPPARQALADSEPLRTLVESHPTPAGRI
jgi:4-hydroxy-tetrahydrodipicolinate synthase